jgi:hypothetical protein
MYQIRGGQARVQPRVRNQFIVFAHARDLWRRDTQIPPAVLQGSYHYTWGIWQQYFCGQLRKFVLPCHWFAEMVDKDYAVFQGAALYQQSWYMRHLADLQAVPYQYRDSILITLGENYAIEAPEERLLDHLCDKVLNYLARTMKMRELDRILKLDDILTSDWEARLHEGEKSDYDITPMTNFDITRLRSNLTRFVKF